MTQRYLMGLTTEQVLQLRDYETLQQLAKEYRAASETGGYHDLSKKELIDMIMEILAPNETLGGIASDS